MTQITKRPFASNNSIGVYLQEISRIPLLTRSEEIEFGRQVQTMLQYEQVKSKLTENLGDSPNLEAWAAALELTIDELEAALEAGKRAKRQMVEANLRLVVKIAKQYQHCDLDLLDLIQEGAIGLQRATEKFDPVKGYRFSTYAYWWIRQAMMRAISRTSRMVRLPIYVIETLGHIKRSQRQLTQQLGRTPTIAEIAQDVELPQQQLRLYLQAAKRPASLEKRVGESFDSELQDLLPDSAMLPIERAETHELSQDVREAIAQLPATLQQILVGRFGLDGGDVLSLAELGQRLGISRERVRQLQQKAFNLIRHRHSHIRKYLAS